MIALLLACGSPEPIYVTTPDPAPSFVDPEAPWLGEAASVAVEIDPGEVAIAMEAAFEALDRLDPAPLVAAYERSIAGAEAGCPSYFRAPEGFDYWFDTCEAGSGSRFDGFGVSTVTEGVPTDVGLLGTTVTVGGSGTMVASDGTELVMNGFVQQTEASDATGTFETIVVSGTFETDDPAAAGTWLEEPWEPEVTVARYALDGVGVVRFATGVIEDVGAARVPVVLQDVAIADVATGFTDCAGEPSGVVSVRLADGWVDVIFDPVDVGGRLETDAAACDGCGEAWAGVTALGPVCPSFAALLR